jgi:hypothetical protein
MTGKTLGKRKGNEKGGNTMDTLPSLTDATAKQLRNATTS